MAESVYYDDEQQQTWNEIESLIDSLAELARSEIAPTKFYEELLTRAMQATAAPSGIVWLAAGEQGFRLTAQVNLPATGLAASTEIQQQHSELLAQTVLDVEPRIVLPQAQVAGASNPTNCLLMLTPVRFDGSVQGIIELFHQEEISPNAQQALLHFATALGDLAAEYHRQQHFSALAKRAGFWTGLNAFAQAVHQNLELEPTQFAIVNETRRLLEVDRVSLLIKRGRKLQLRAVSSVEKIHRRAESVRSLERLAKAVLATNESLWTTRQSAGPLAPQIEVPLGAYLDVAHSRSLAIIPLMTPEPVTGTQRQRPPVQLGALVIESFDATWGEDMEHRVAATQPHVQLALHQSLRFHRFPLRRVLSPLAGMRWFVELQQLPKTVTALLLLVLVGLALWLIPAPLGIEARGTLQPASQRELFAPIDGIVSEVLIDHGSEVATSDVLILLRRPELELQRSQVLGELQTAKTQLASLEAARLSGTADPETSADQLTAKEEELKQRVASLESQQQILNAQQKQLQVRSPLRGEVLTWNARQMLDARPVQRGQSLLLVADLNDRWELRLNVLDRQMGYVLEAARQQSPLPVTFYWPRILGVRFQGRVERIADVTILGADDRPTVEVTVAFDRSQIPAASLRPGSSVVAEIDCGPHSLGYVWLHDLIDAAWTYVLF